MSHRILLFVATVLLLVNACNPFIDPAVPDDTSTVRTTLTGRVTDEAGKSVAGALVRGHGKTTTTNNNGVFVLSDVVVPSTRAVVIVSKGGYFTGARAAYPSASKTTTMLLTLQQAKQTRTISAASGGQVAVGAATVDLPANGYVDAQGNAYTGTVSVAARYLDPTADNFYDSFSGDMAALRADGSSTELISYGVLRVKLTGSQGQPLNLRQGASATLTYPASGATDISIPLWHFDETRGIWVEEGTATRVGGNYVGTVSHFTDWNLDVPSPRVAFIEGRVTCGEDIPLAGIAVDIGQATAVTDQDGMYRRRVPADITFDVEVKGSRNEGISASPVSVGPISQNQTLVHDIVVSPCPTSIEAQMVDCDSVPIGGVLEILTDKGVTLYSSTTGRFFVPVPAGKGFVLEGRSIAGLVVPSRSIQPLTSGTVFRAGALRACGNSSLEMLDIEIPDLNDSDGGAVAMNFDGTSLAAVFGDAVYVYDATTGKQRWMAETPPLMRSVSAIRFVSNESLVAVTGFFGTAFFNASTGQLSRQVSASGIQFVTSNGESVYVLADSARRRTIIEYDAMSGAQKRVLPSGLEDMNGTLLGLQGDDHAIMQQYSPSAFITVNLKTGSVVKAFRYESAPGAQATPAYLSASGKVAMILRKDAGSGSSVGSTVVDLVSETEISRVPFVTESPFTRFAISPDDATYVFIEGIKPDHAYIYDLRTLDLQRRLPWTPLESTDRPSFFSFSGNGSRVVAMQNGYEAKRAIQARIYTLK